MAGNNQEMVEVPVPYSIEAEESVVGLLLWDPNNIIKVSGLLEREDFYREGLGAVYGAIEDLYKEGTPADVVTVLEKLRDRGGETEIYDLVHLADYLPTTYNIRYHAEIVSRMAELRRLISAGGEIAALGYERNETGVLEKATQILSRVQRKREEEFVPVGEVLQRHLDTLAWGEGGYGVPTGFTYLDQATGGWQRGDLIVIAAGTSVGKTAFMLRLARNAAVQGYAAAIMELEMRREALVNRLIAAEAGVGGQALALRKTSAEEWAKVEEASEWVRTLPIFIDDAPSVTVASLRSRINRLMAEQPVEVVFVDYLQLLEASPAASRQNRVAQVTELSRGLKLLAREIDRPLIVLSQLNREPEKRHNHEPQRSDMRESGSIEMDADLLVALHREDRYDPDTWKAGLAEVILLKQRNGPLTRVPLGWDAATTSFTNVTYGDGRTR